MNKEDQLLYDNVFGQLANTLHSVYHSFTDAYNKIESKKNVNEAISSFKRNVSQVEFVLESADFYLDKFHKENVDELIIRYGSFLDIATKACHNLSYYYHVNKEEEKSKQWKDKEHVFQGWLVYIYYLSMLLESDKEAIAILRRMVEGSDVEYMYKAFGDLLLLYFASRNQMVDKYLKLKEEIGSTHYYSSFRIIQNIKDEKLLEASSVVGTLLISNLDNPNIRDLIYECSFYEVIAIHYAYENNDIQKVNKIIQSGYDYYLELETLSEIYSFEPSRLPLEMRKLKRICLKRLIEKSKTIYQGNYFFRSIYDSEFLDAVNKYAESFIEDIDPEDKNDPRNHEDRISPSWYKKKK